MATQYYISVNDMDTVAKDPAHIGTTSTSADIIELRVGDGTYVPTHRQVLNALEIIKRAYIQGGGAAHAGLNLPPNRG